MKVINTNNAPSAIGPYCQAIECNGILYVSGQIPLNPKTMEVCSLNVKEQTEQCLSNLNAILHEAGCTPKDVVKCQVFIKDMEEFPIVNEAYAKFFGNHKPVRICVEVARLPKDVRVEIDATVCVGSGACGCKN